MTEGRDAASSAVGQDATEVGAIGDSWPAGPVRHGGILGVADRFRDDDGSADPAAAAALSAFAAGTGSEHAALLALAAARLLVPVVAEDSGSAGPRAGTGAGEKSSDMALPTLVGRDGRRALPVFTSLDAVARWQPSARPVPADAALVWRAAAEDACAVVIDVAGPVPLAVEGARLIALARGEPVPAPHEDPDVQAAVGTVIAEALAGLPAPAAPATGALVGFALHPGVDGGDLLIELTVAPVIDAENLAARVGSAALERLSPRLRRGVALMLSEPG